MLIVKTRKGPRLLREISRVDLVHLDRDPHGVIGANFEDGSGVLKAWIYHFVGGGAKVVLAKTVTSLCPGPGKN